MLEVDGWILEIRKRIGKEAEMGFISTFVCGLFVHLMAYVHHTPTYSGLLLFENDGSWPALEGKWFAGILEGTISRVTIPFFIGILSLLFWALSFAVIVKIFDIKSRSAIFLMSAIYISFPTIAAMNCFLYMSHCHAISAFFACFGVWLVSKKQRYFNLIGILCLVLSLASYQVFLSSAMVLIFVIVAFDVIDGKDIREIWVEIGKYGASIIISLGLYYITFKMYLHLAQVQSYRDFTLTIDSIMQGIIKCYGGAYWFLIRESIFSTSLGRAIFVITLASIIMIAGRLLFFRWGEYNNKFIRILMLTGMVVISPIIANYAFVVSPYETRSYRQFAAWAILFLLPIILCERYMVVISGFWNKKKQRILQSIVITTTIISIMFFAIIDNIAYMNAYLQYEREYSLVVRIVDRIESTDGYEPGMPVIIMFNNLYASLYEGELDTKLDKYIPGMEQQGWGYISTPEGIINFVNYFIQTDMNIQWEPIDSNMLEEMDKWPKKKCVLIQDGKLYMWLT